MIIRSTSCAIFFFFNDTATTEIYTLSLHDALPICRSAEFSHPQPDSERHVGGRAGGGSGGIFWNAHHGSVCARARSEEHTSELQSHLNIVCRLLLEKKKSTEDSDTIV